MGKYERAGIIGLRDKDNNRLIAVYPEKVYGDDETIEKKVLDWYYNQGCTESEKLLSCKVDTLTDKELKTIEAQNRLH